MKGTLFIKVTEDGQPIFESKEWENRPVKLTEQMFLEEIRKAQIMEEAGQIQIARLPQKLFCSPFQNTTAQQLRGMTATQAGALAIQLVDEAGWSHTPQNFIKALNNYLTD